MTIVIASTSVEPIEATVQSDIDPSSATVKAIYLAAGAASPSPASGSWVTGTWQTAVANGAGYVTPARFTVSSLAVGLYDIWVYIDGATYDPVRKAGQLKIV